jgi:uncharacterized membrane protein YphA (DoxX/SURF4 family)
MDRTTSPGGMTMPSRLIESFILAARLVLGGAFVVASISKIADPAAFAASIGYYHLLPTGSLMLVATVLPWLELLCGLGLIFGIAPRANALLVFLMLFVFTAGVGSALARGLDISCGCFTQDPGAGRIGWLKLLENGGLLFLSAFLYFRPGTLWSLDTTQRHLSPPARTTANESTHHP